MWTGRGVLWNSASWWAMATRRGGGGGDGDGDGDGGSGERETHRLAISVSIGGELETGATLAELGALSCPDRPIAGFGEGCVMHGNAETIGAGLGGVRAIRACIRTPRGQRQRMGVSVGVIVGVGGGAQTRARGISPMSTRTGQSQRGGFVSRAYPKKYPKARLGALVTIPRANENLRSTAVRAYPKARDQLARDPAV